MRAACPRPRPAATARASARGMRLLWQVWHAPNMASLTCTCDGASVGTRCGRCSLSVTKPRRMARTQRRQKRIEWVAMVVGTYEMSDVRRPRRLEMAATSSASATRAA
eukprot:1165306-Prymnesium_polylepis.1